ncbi:MULTISPECIES: hypothetical protein [Streptomyces]|uniref:Uncharacterized protein n=1 Tax=Streptomyces doebereineriae TaxID=3075528 RepID=A0ABU2VJC3_9ACTN|nr:hypothetical protein [Streptomyces sp. DSM 41640]MDT0484992.1 hypothetical protein [Streptomyces sp. DSM 41640]
MTPPTKKLLRRAPAVLAAGLAAVLPFAGTASASPLVGHAHRTVTAADGETFHLRLTAESTFLPAAGGTVDVRGKGYNRAQGIFLAFCVIPDGVVAGDPSTYTTLPTPCLGGRESTDGSARRITDQGTGTPGVTIPYEKGGRFTTTLDLKPEIADGVVCDATVKCAIVTRADYTATGNRLYDQYIPVHFAPADQG